MLRDGSVVLLKKNEREFLVSIGGGELHTDLGVIKLSLLRGRNFGEKIATHLGHEFLIIQPRMLDFFSKLRRTGAPMLPKDIGVIIAYTGISPSDKVLDAGTGSGILAIFLGNIVRSGKVISYEKNEEFVKIARENVSLAGLENVEVRHGDIFEEIEKIEEQFDIVTLDLEHAHKLIPKLRRVLKLGGYMAAYSPYIEHTKEIRSALERERYSEIRTIEIIEREIEFGEKGTRPSTKVGHSGYITIARLI
ncbi:MAG: methyltransferase domain-containing protein [Methanocellales archaeon]